MKQTSIEHLLQTDAPSCTSILVTRAAAHG